MWPIRLTFSDVYNLSMIVDAYVQSQIQRNEPEPDAKNPPEGVGGEQLRNGRAGAAVAVNTAARQALRRMSSRGRDQSVRISERMRAISARLGFLRLGAVAA